MKKIKKTDETVTIEFSRFEALMIMSALGTEVNYWREKKDSNMVETKEKIDQDFFAIIKRS